MWLSVLVITMPTKGKLLLTVVSIVNWITGCASFTTERKSVIAVRSGTRAKVSSADLLQKLVRNFQSLYYTNHEFENRAFDWVRLIFFFLVSSISFD